MGSPYNKIKDTFPNIKADSHMEAFLSSANVKDAIYDKKDKLLTVSMISDKIIDTDMLCDMELAIKEAVFGDGKERVHIDISFELAGDYDLEVIYESYKDNIFKELADIDPLACVMLRRSDISFEMGDTMLVKVEDLSINKDIADKLKYYIEETIFAHRFHKKVLVDFEYMPRQGYSRKEEYIKIDDEIDEDKMQENHLGKDEESQSNEDDPDIRKEKHQQEQAQSQDKSDPKDNAGIQDKPQTQDKQSNDNFMPADNKKTKTKTKRRKIVGDEGMLFGKSFDGEYVDISDLDEMLGKKVLVKGTLFNVDIAEIRSGSKIYKCAITDDKDSISIVMFADPDRFDIMDAAIKDGAYVGLSAMVTVGDYDGETILKNVTGMKALDKEIAAGRKDNAKIKRIELHCHTKMSDLDAVSDVSDIIKQASSWGMEAVAITDHGNVQAFPDAFKCIKGLKKAGKNAPKIIYGVEGYLVDDTGELVVNAGSHTFEDRFVIFDIETTGFSADRDAIIEIGAVAVKDGEIVDRFSTFVNPQRPIPYRITELTGIDDSMVADADDISKVLPEFISFCKDSILVAHNAQFDTSFIRKACEREGIAYDYAHIDTVSLSQMYLPHLGRFKLDHVAKALDISLDNHHRAVDDARCCADIFIKLSKRVSEDNIHTLEELSKAGRNNTDLIKKAKMYHVIILIKNEIGRVNLYKIISKSHIQYYARKPRIPRSLLQNMRDGLIVGSACEAGELYSAAVRGVDDEDLADIASFYDYLEIQPVGNNKFMIEDDHYDIHSEDDIRKVNQRIVDIGDRLGKIVVATGDVHFLNPEDELYRRIIFFGNKYPDAENQPPLYFHTTDEMLDEFSYLGAQKCEEVVVTNTHKIADMIEEISPVRPDKCPPVIENSDKMLREDCYKKAHQIYGDNLPQIVEERLDKELTSIIGNGYAVLYIIAKKLVEHSNEEGYLVGSRGSVGSSFVAYTAGITEVNPLPPHYVCTECQYSEFDSDDVKAYADRAGFDMPDKICPICGAKLRKDGFDIPFETFLGFKGDKEPDIDLNFSDEYQSRAHAYTEVIFGKGKTFRAGTIGTLAAQTAYGYVKNYYEAHGIKKRKCEIERLLQKCVGVKRTTGQHPGGIVVVPHDEEIYSFTPIQYPANKEEAGTYTTHFEYHAIDANLLKLDELGHQDPTVIKMLGDLTGIDPVRDIPLDSKEVMKLFQGTEPLKVSPDDIGKPLGTLGIPEFNTDVAMQMLIEAKPQGITDLVRISGLAHGTDVWFNNAQDLINEGKATIGTAICTRDDIMIGLIAKGMEKSAAFTIMESVRKGKGLTKEQEQLMIDIGIPDWYIWSCKQIKYMFPKAHAAAYVMMAWRIAYCKIYYPLAYYATYFSIRASGFSYGIMCRGLPILKKTIKEYEDKGKRGRSVKENESLKDMYSVLEMYARGFEFTSIDIYKAKAKYFIITEDKKIMPSFMSIDGLGETVARQIEEEASKGQFLSKEDFRNRTKVSTTICDAMDEFGLLKGLPDSSQISLFDSF